MRPSRLLTIAALALGMPAAPAQATAVLIDDSDFVLAPTFSNVSIFRFELLLDEPIVPGGTYRETTVARLDYRVFGSLAAGTPSGFPAFFLMRDMDGEEFRDQGSSLDFEVSAAADLSDGLQLSELAGAGAVFTLNAREIGTGRFHPPILILNADGTGLMRNSDNFGGVNSGNGKFVDVDIGEEYVLELSFDPAELTLARGPFGPSPSPAGEVPLPAAGGLLAAAGCLLTAIRRRRRFR